MVLMLLTLVCVGQIQKHIRLSPLYFVDEVFVKTEPLSHVRELNRSIAEVEIYVIMRFGVILVV